MRQTATHAPHPHVHAADCGHTAIEHAGHVDYLHDGHLHHQGVDGTVEEHAIPVGANNPEGHTSATANVHEPAHRHGADCGHEPVPHGNHVDYLVGARLHHPHDDHCDDHGSVKLA